MNPWKVILATLVIFVAGLITGGMAVKKLAFRPHLRPLGQSREMNAGLPSWAREEFVRRMAIELNLSHQQTQRILKTVRESQERIHELYSLIGPEMREELDYVRECFRAELTLDQAQRFDEIRERQRRFGEMGRPRPHAPLNSPGPPQSLPPANRP